MSEATGPAEATDFTDPILVALKSQEARITALENPTHKSFFKRLSENASAAALFLGLVLSFGSLRDTFWTKPEADRISQVSQFNQAVNAAAKLRQDILTSQLTNPALQLAMMSTVTPQIENNISTAKLISRDLHDSDIGIPQLIILIDGASVVGDLDSVKELVTRAVNKTDVSPFLRSEAKRYEAKYFFAAGDSAHGEASFRDALNLLGTKPTSARAFVLGDQVIVEFRAGDCQHAAEDFKTFVATLNSGYIAPQEKAQIALSVKQQLMQASDQGCPKPEALDTLLPG